MPRMRCIAGAVTLAVGSVGFGLLAATAQAQVGGTSTVTGTAHAGAATATGSETSGGGGTAAVAAPSQAPAPVVPSGPGGGALSNNAVQVIAGNNTGPCSPIVAQQVNNSNNQAQVAQTNDSGNAVGNIGNGNGRGTGGTENHVQDSNNIGQNVNVSCFNSSSPQTVTNTVVVPKTVTQTVVVPKTVTQTVVQQAPVAAPVTTAATFTG